MGLTRTFSLNGQSTTVTVDDPTERLLYVLRDRLGQRGPKFGCGVAQCGACTVLVDGRIVRACIAPLDVTVAEGGSVETLDGLGTPEEPHALQACFIKEQAGQCAFCINGMIMGAKGWIELRVAGGNTTVPTEDEIRAFLSGRTGTAPPLSFNYLCRCGTHQRIVTAIASAAAEMLS